MGKQERSVRMSLQTLRTLEAFLESPTDELSGSDVQKRSGLASGTLYPMVCQPVGSCRSRKRRTPAAAALPTDTEWTCTGK